MVTTVEVAGTNGIWRSTKLPVTSRPIWRAIASIAGLNTEAGIPRFITVTSCVARSWRAATGT
jgi:hypothetical protein